MPDVLTITLSVLAAVWTMLTLVVGIAIGWRLRMGMDPLPPLTLRFRKKPAEPKPSDPETPKLKPQDVM